MGVSKSNRQDCLRAARPVQSTSRDKNVYAQHGRGWSGKEGLHAWRRSEQFIDQTHSPHGASAFPSYAPSGCTDQPFTQAQSSQARHAYHTACLLFRAHSLGGCCQQLAVTASGWWMVYYTASITLIHSSEGKPPARCPPRLLGGRGGRAADETEAARARRRVLTLGGEGG